MSLLDKYKIEDKQVNEVLKEVVKIAEDGKSGNAEQMDREITKNDLGKMTERKPYIDGKNNRLVFKIGNKLFKADLTELQ